MTLESNLTGSRQRQNLKSVTRRVEVEIAQPHGTACPSPEARGPSPSPVRRHPNPSQKNGDIFEIKTYTPEARPLSSFKLLEMQWPLQRVIGMVSAMEDRGQGFL